MNAEELLQAVEKFRADIGRFAEALYANDFNDGPYSEVETIGREVRVQLGQLQPYINQHLGGSPMLEILGRRFEIFEDACSENTHPYKGRSFSEAKGALDRMIGSLQAKAADEDMGDAGDLLIRAIGLLHPFIASSCTKLFTTGHPDKAVEQAGKCVLEHIRQKSGIKLDGDALVTQAFGQDRGKLRLNDGTNLTDADEQQGFMKLVQGFNQHVRNVHAHRHSSPLDPVSALEHLAVASMICRRVDDCTVGTKATNQEVPGGISGNR